MRSSHVRTQIIAMQRLQVDLAVKHRLKRVQVSEAPNQKRIYLATYKTNPALACMHADIYTTSTKREKIDNTWTCGNKRLSENTSRI